MKPIKICVSLITVFFILTSSMVLLEGTVQAKAKKRVKKSHKITRTVKAKKTKRVVKRVKKVQVPKKVQAPKQVQVPKKVVAAPAVRTPDFGVLSVSSNVNGVDIYVDEEIVAKAPVNVTVEKGRHLLEAYNGSELIYRQIVLIEPNRTNQVQIDGEKKVASQDTLPASKNTLF